MSRQKNTTKPPIFVYVGYFLVATLLFTGVTFSGYITVTTAEDRSRVARFDIEESGVQEHYITEKIIPGETAKQELKVKSTSEVAVEYTIIVEKLTTNLPITFKVGSLTPETDGNTCSFTDTIPANDTAERVYTLELEWPDDKAEYRSAEHAGQVDLIKVTVNATQKD